MNRQQRRAKPSKLTQSLLLRAPEMQSVRNRIMLQFRMFRNMLAEREGTEEMWGELAGLINVFGLYTQRKQMPQFQAIQGGATALLAIEARNMRVGGRWAGTGPEIDALTEALNAIDDELLPKMPMVEFVRIAVELNDLAERERQAAA